ncbi:MAG: 2-keto-4-pentenoate hydratase [Neisseria sp.]|uniref:2-keto-4-pentenoate hydratase n=1 Tax=Neisseria sp. TaxID=192066 RepID=UPI0026DCBD64|nr:fumarylacetoacetate hydrolase family protein [Neisseria sp.]MDO4249028.1 2-keto-4-pentenoate hydratase [Neisseria sp.]
MTQQMIQQAADALWQAQRSQTACPPVREWFSDGLDVDTAYQIQQINIERAVREEGRRVVGKKIGLTSVAVQKQLGVDQPDFGSIFADMVVAEGESVHLSGLIQPKVEAEVALVLKHDLLLPQHTLTELIHAVDYALPAIEIVDSRVQGWNIRIGDTVADNASSALVAIGQQPVLLKDLALTKIGMAMYQSGDLVSSGNGAACLGNPLVAALWLANTMAARGMPLKAGNLILTGALGPMVPVTQPSAFKAEIQDLGEINLVFED